MRNDHASHLLNALCRLVMHCMPAKAVRATADEVWGRKSQVGGRLSTSASDRSVLLELAQSKEKRIGIPVGRLPSLALQPPAGL